MTGTYVRDTVDESGSASRPSTVQDLVAAMPAADLAVVAPDASLTYGELLERADTLADQLRSLGVTPDSRVALCLPPSAALVVAALGILRSGGAYVALDPDQPEQRLRALVGAARADLLIGSSAAQSAVDAPTVATVPGVGHITRLRPVQEASTTREGGLTGEPADASGAAYVVFTSGSTGTPKGVVVEQAGLLNLARWHQRAFGVRAGERCSQIGGVGFDAAAWEIWGCLTAGATLVVAPQVLKTDPTGLRDWLVTERVTVSFVPTPVAEALLALDWPDDAALRVLLTGGDRLHRAPRPGLTFEVVNNYGVSEASVVTTSGTVAAGAQAAPSIGRAIDGVVLRIVDGALADVAAGEAGELLIGGVSVARGYLDEPELTARRFFTGSDGTRWYRSGDVVRLRADGELDYVSRVDEQVQIRGNRVEPGEIVAALDRYAGVLRSEVLTTGDDAGTPRLVACVQPRGPVDVAGLHEHLTQWLPTHMIPSEIVLVDDLPLTANGKIDREALRAVVDSRAVAPSGAPVDTPVDELEQTVVDLVASLLGLPVVGAHEDFLLLGGHSMMGAQLVTRLADRFGVEISLRELFDNPTPAGMAELVRTQLLEQVLAMDDETAARLAGTE